MSVLQATDVFNQGGMMQSECRQKPCNYRPIDSVSLFIIITGAFVVGNLIVIMFMWLYLEKNLGPYFSEATLKELEMRAKQQVQYDFETLNTTTIRTREQIEEQQLKERQRAAEQRRLEEQKRQESLQAHQRNVQVCQFWKEQYRKETSESNKTLKGEACSRAYPNEPHKW